MSLPATIQTAVSQSMIHRVSRFSNHSVHDALIEILQNSRRAGATRVDIDSFNLSDRPVLAVRDNGSGIDDPAKLVTLGDSGWNGEIADREDPAGMGVFSLAGHRVEIRSFSTAANQGWSVVIAPDAWESGAPLAIEPCAIECGTEILIDMAAGWGDTLEAAAKKATTYYPLQVFLQGEPCARKDFLADAHRVELWNGCRIGVIRGRNYRSSPEEAINFHGLTVVCPMPSVSEVGADQCWHVRVDIVDAPALQLVLPARKEMVQNAALAELREAAEAAIYRTIATTGSHRLANEQWQRAQALGVILPEAAPWLSGWLPRTGDGDGIVLGERIAGIPMVLVPNEEPHIEQCAGRVLCAGLPLGGVLVREVAGFEGYGWYDALPRISELSFSVENDAGVHSYGTDTVLPEGIESGRVARIMLDVAVKSSRGATGEDGRYSLPTDVLIAPDEGWYADLDQTTILLACDSTITPHELASLIEDSCFCPSDDCGDDSWETQHSYFEKRARHVANNLLLGEEAAILERIRDVLRDEVTWLVPEGRRVAIVAERSEVTLSYVSAEVAGEPA
jgi:hypothetical protein